VRQALVDKDKRIHCSLNLNTETGRLSSRRPNLQNQPALEKDQYKIRDAFVAEEGKTLIVADYGQLELRILAHISNCTSMIEAFRQVRTGDGVWILYGPSSSAQLERLSRYL
jgi:DNA polymerase-1